MVSGIRYSQSKLRLKAYLEIIGLIYKTPTWKLRECEFVNILVLLLDILSTYYIVFNAKNIYKVFKIRYRKQGNLKILRNYTKMLKLRIINMFGR